MSAPKALPLKQKLMRLSAWLLFICTATLMILGATLAPERAPLAQEPPTAEASADQGKDAAPLEEKAQDMGAATAKADAGVDAAPPSEQPKAEPAQATDKPAADKQDAQAKPADTAKAPPVLTKPKVGEGQKSGFLERAISFLGIFALIGVAVLLSNNRRAINWKLVGVGTGLQLFFAIIIFYVPGGRQVFDFATQVIKKLLDFTGDGSKFIFSSYVTGSWEAPLINFTFAVLPTIIFFSSLMTIMYHLGIMQRIVYVFAAAMQKTMGTSGAESLSAAANIFVGQTEAPLVIKPYVNEMTNSELMTVMTGGFATVAGGVLAIYVGMLEPSFPEIAGHLLAASVMSAPAALVIGKIIYPETETPVTSGTLDMNTTKEDQNVIDAASRGAAEGLQLALNVGAMLLAFIALMAMINYVIGLPGMLWNKGILKELVAFFGTQQLTVPDGCSVASVADDKIVTCIETMRASLQGKSAPEALLTGWVAPIITLQTILGYLFWPFAFIMGVPASDCVHIGRLLGEKMILNELVAYSSLKNMLVDPSIQLSDRSVIIATYALCGFANVGSIGIQLGGIGGIAPKRKHDLAKIAVKAMLAGTIAAFMTATIAGILV